MKLTKMTQEQLVQLKNQLGTEYQSYLGQGLKLDMSRGILSRAQLDLTQDMLSNVRTPEESVSENGSDCRNYGLLDGIPEAKKLFADLLEVSPDNVIVGGNSSLNLMYDMVSRGLMFGCADVNIPWIQQGKVKFLCPVPGYDRHFAICELFGIEMINVPMTESGPDMDVVEELVKNDDMIKGIWCVPKYSNPNGVVYSDETIRRFASLKPKAKDFRIFWDNAYIVHSLYGEPAKQLNILEEAKKYNNENIVYIFASTSKISYAGSGISAIAASEANVKAIKSQMSIQTIGHDKVNQLRHVRYFGSAEGILEHMKKHAAIIAPKFKLVDEIFERELRDLEIAEWSKPEGGYFITLDVMKGCAKRVYELMCKLGINLTPAGAPFPYKKDEQDRTLRIAPTYPPLDELKTASEALCLCVKIAAIEKLLA